MLDQIKKLYEEATKKHYGTFMNRESFKKTYGVAEYHLEMEYYRAQIETLGQLLVSNHAKFAVYNTDSCVWQKERQF